jgi:hypothetical protein
VGSTNLTLLLGRTCRVQLAAAHAGNETLQRPMKVIDLVCGALGVTLLPCDDERIVCG